MDNFLPSEVAEGLLREIAQHQDFRKSNDYIFAKNKFESPRIENFGEHGAALRDFLLSPAFAAALSAVYGKPLFVDPDFVGGGLHRGGEGSYLDMHTDFNLHPRNKTWVRELNLLLYLNKGWQPAHGGCLDLRHGDSGQTAAVQPLFNRMVIMLTKDFTFHGYKPIAFPAGTFRTSIAAYAYSLAASAEEVAHLRTTTSWAPGQDTPVRALIAKATPGLVSIKQRFFGSATARKK
jgi:Rps23 Pro-64 3,4-dihydroxylase Tpa1-like proline 4-hydroxylase